MTAPLMSRGRKVCRRCHRVGTRGFFALPDDWLGAYWLCAYDVPCKRRVLAAHRRRQA